jgi:(p)ppGpp synthase/HD superfamily hydrolase
MRTTVVHERAAAMAGRLADTALRAGWAAPDAAGLSAVFEAAVLARMPHVGDPHEPDYLHPARTALILMDDVGVADPAVIAAGLLWDSRPVPAQRLLEIARHAAGPHVETLLHALPDPVPAADAGDLLEALVTAPTEVALIAIAERLDHARHLHLRDRQEWTAFHALAVSSYAIAAQRLDPVLARRWRWWTQMFRRRYLDLP